MVSTEDLIDALRLRLRFPIGQRNERPEQIGYAEACFADRPDYPIVILPVGFWESEKHRPLRERLFNGHFPTHVAEIGSIWSPATAIPFQLVLLSKIRRMCCILQSLNLRPLCPRMTIDGLGTLQILNWKCVGRLIC